MAVVMRRVTPSAPQAAARSFMGWRIGEKWGNVKAGGLVV